MGNASRSWPSGACLGRGRGPSPCFASKRAIASGVVALSVAGAARVHDSQEGPPCSLAVGAETSSRRAVAGRERELLLGLGVIGVEIASTVEGAAMALEDLLHAKRGPLGDVSHLVDGRGWQRVEHERRGGLFAHAHAVQREQVKVHVEPEVRVAALDDAHRTGVSLPDRREPEALLRAPLERAAAPHHKCLEHLGA